MERTVNGNLAAYRIDDDTIYVVTMINEVAGLLAATNLHEDASQHVMEIWEDTGLQKLIIFCPDHQTEYKAAIKSAGFKQEGRLKRATPDGDLLVFGQYRV